jgi:RecB family exonuclease
VQCLTAPVATGTAPTAAQVATSSSQPCAQYRYSPVGGAANFSTPQDQIYSNQSLYAIRIGARFTF